MALFCKSDIKSAKIIRSVYLPYLRGLIYKIGIYIFKMEVESNENKFNLK